MKSEIVPVTDLDDEALGDRLKADGLRLTPNEARQVQANIGRNPSRLEAVLFDTLWSEHCSYKSSRQVLKTLPTDAPHVILGPGEDAGVVYLTTHEGERWGLVVAHESHNHPSQIVPAEGAATGIGGVVRDVYCMGAEVVGVLDALRFGDPAKPECREIAAGVVDGIWHYGNALGVPNLGGDTVFHEDFSENCLVNVVALGVVPIKRLVRSRVPKEAKETPYVFILVGKPTDASGFGGASFASAVLDEEEESANKGAVQLPDPFLKRVLSEANRAVLDMAAEEGFALGFKDLGAGGIACATSELASAGGFGADIELGAVSIDGEFFPPEVIACSETQERYCLAVPQEYAQPILQIYNVDYELPHLYPGARAQVVGSVRAQDTTYRITHQGDEVCHLPVELITEGIRYDREVGEVPEPGVEHAPPEPDNYEALLKELMTGPSQGSRSQIYRMYDTEVQGRAVIRPGEADAAVIAPIPGNPVGLAVSVDGNPNYGKIDAYQGGASSV
ncbi:MAG: phosphoribosylformylglycinamidine synthase, partial [Candidatus Eisenbacteria bacterium]|nr:phosphoribosylformylglycinamidine synthase [Candidatus Eisenbacteria bacterium]